jgi:hypothetical protein
VAVAVVHSTVATLPDEPGAEINKAEWNAAHSVTGLGTAAEADTGDFDAAGAADAAIVTHVALPDPHAQYALESALGSLATVSNLTGPITSVGAATSIAAQTGTGTTFAMQDSPSFTTPAIGAATGTSLVATAQLQAGTHVITTNFRAISGGLFTFSDNGGGTGAMLGYLGSRANLRLFSTPGVTTAGAYLWAEAPNVLLLADGVNAQALKVSGTYTDGSNYVRASLAATSTAVTLAAETAGTGADDIGIALTPAGTGVVTAPLISISYSPGSFVLATERGAVLTNHLKLTGSQRATLQGTARLRIA